jgi:hypothetical protein
VPAQHFRTDVPNTPALFAGMSQIIRIPAINLSLPPLTELVR